MRRLIGILLLLALLCALVSCGPGASVPFFTLQTRASFDQVWTDPNILSFTEVVNYSDFSYSLYYERAEKAVNRYNICEKRPDILYLDKPHSSITKEKVPAYSFCAHEGELYAVNGDVIYTILPLFDLYSDFVRSYETLTHPLDAGTHYQIRATAMEDGTKTVSYRSEITLAMEADLAGYGAAAGQYVFSEYTVDENGRYLSISYSIGATEEAAAWVCKRDFTYSSEKASDVFASLPDQSESVTVTLTLPSGSGESYRIPRGIAIGIDLPGSNRTIECYRDADMTEPFDTKTLITDNITLYVKVTEND